MALDDLLSILRCPVCAGAENGMLEEVNPSWLWCRHCSRKYPVVDTVVVMLADEGDRWRDVAIEQLPHPEHLPSDASRRACEGTS